MKDNKFSRKKTAKTSIEIDNQIIENNVEYINDHQRDRDTSLQDTGSDIFSQEHDSEIISEKSFFRGVKNKIKDFIKTKAKDISRSAKKVFAQIKKDFMQPKSKDKFKPGTMVAFTYNAKDTKKRFDKKPLIICLGWAKGKLGGSHFFGLNVHWMPMKDRVALAGFFAALSARKKGVTYDDIKPFMSRFKGHPILRMYIYKNVSGKVIEMPREHFLTASAIPTEVWMGGS